MPKVKRDDMFMAAMAEMFHAYGLWDKMALTATFLVTTFCFIIPHKLPEALGLVEPRLNVGRLKTVVKDQIYQQLYWSGNTQSTIFKSRKGDGLLIYIPPKITQEFLEDIKKLAAPVKYIIAANASHEHFAEDAKKAFPEATVLTPKACRKLVEEAVAVDATIEESMQVLETDFGFTKVFRYDNCCGMAERSYQVELFASKDEPKKSYCLFVGQCGMGNYSKFAPTFYLAGFQNLFQPRGRVFRHYYYSFTNDHSAVRPYWMHMIKSIPDNLDVAAFIHGDPIVGSNDSVRGQLLQFYFY